MPSLTTTQLVQLLRSQVSSLSGTWAQHSLIVGAPSMKSADLPERNPRTPHKRTGPRKVVKGRRTYGNLRYYVGEWLKDNLQEITFPKIAYIVSGSAEYLLGDSSIHCEPGDIILMPPFVPHQRSGPFFKESARHNRVCVLLHAIAHKHGIIFWYSRSVNEQHINDFADNYLIPNVNAAAMLRLLMDESSKNWPDFASIGRGLITAFLALVASEIEAGNFVRPISGESSQMKAWSEADFPEQVRNYVEANHHKPLRLETVAGHLFMSRAQFVRRMRCEMNMTFVELLTSVRVEHACQMLTQSTLSIAWISSLLGYRSPTHFLTIFRAATGCTPTEYRKKHT